MCEQVQVTIDTANNTVVFTVGDTFTFQQFQDAFERTLHDERYDKNMNILWDLRAVRTVSMIRNKSELYMIRDYVKQNSDHYGTGFEMAIVTSSDLMFGFARMYEMISEELPFDRRAFRDFDEACIWLGWNQSGPTTDNQ